MYKEVNELKGEVKRWKRAQENLVDFFGKMFGKVAAHNPDDLEQGSKKDVLKNGKSELLKHLMEGE